MERLRGHYRESLITPWLQLCSITPVKIHPHPRVKKVKESLSSQLFVAAPSSALRAGIEQPAWLPLAPEPNRQVGSGR